MAKKTIRIKFDKIEGKPCIVFPNGRVVDDEQVQAIQKYGEAVKTFLEVKDLGPEIPWPRFWEGEVGE